MTEQKQPEDPGVVGWAGAIIVIIICLVLAFLVLRGFWNFLSTDSEDPWCEQTRQFWAENPHDTNPSLRHAYDIQCGS